MPFAIIGLGWSLAAVAQAVAAPVAVETGIDAIVSGVVQAARPGDHVLVMSNGAFGGIHDKLIKGLESKAHGS